jgi:hypothetical protein
MDEVEVSVMGGLDQGHRASAMRFIQSPAWRGTVDLGGSVVAGG